jgi:hypothetical protein
VWHRSADYVLLARAGVFSPQAEVHSRDIAELMPMSADVPESSGNTLPFTCNALSRERKLMQV